MLLAQASVMALLLFYGWRIGWRLTERVPLAIASASGMGAGGVVLTALKHAADKAGQDQIDRRYSATHAPTGHATGALSSGFAMLPNPGN